MKLDPRVKIPFPIVLLISAILLSIAVDYAQIEYLGLHFIRVQQEKVHEEMLGGIAGNPWQYRILADLMLEPIIATIRDLGVSGPEPVAFIGFRFFQNLLILITAGLYYRKLGLASSTSLMGLSILAWSLSYSLYNSDLSFNVFFDIFFYLLAAILIMEGKLVWIIVLMVPAAFNRETSLLILVMLISFFYFGLPGRPARRLGIVAAAGLAVYAAIFAGLRLHYGQQAFLTADGYYPGLDLLLLNLRRSVTWEQLLITVGIIPLLAILAYRGWPRPLRIFFWAVVPVWIGVHFVAALVAETRLMLVPQALVFVPGALFALSAGAQPQEAVSQAADRIAAEPPSRQPFG